MNPVMQLPTDQAHFCAHCGAADVVVPALSGGEASCNVCGWKGRAEELAAFPFSHDMGMPQEVFQRFFLDVRRLISLQFARDFASVLVKWGFLDEPTEKNAKKTRYALARYIGATAKAIVVGVVKTRAELEKEQHASPGN